jgi:hypothetical protein
MDDRKGKLAAPQPKKKESEKNKVIIPTKQIDRRQRIAGKLMSSSSIARNSLLDIIENVVARICRSLCGRGNLVVLFVFHFPHNFIIRATV